MQTSDRNSETRNGAPNARTNFTGGKALAFRPSILKLLFAILASSLLTIAGPTASHTVTHVVLISLQILLEVARLALATSQIFGN